MLCFTGERHFSEKKWLVVILSQVIFALAIHTAFTEPFL
jgi:hypothetical protein